MLKQLITLVALTFAAVTAHAETPQEAAKAIHDLLETENYAELFPARYSEWHKVAAEGVAPEQAIEKLAGMFKKQREPLLAIYSQLADADFTLGDYEYAQVTETGKVATATVKLGEREIPFKLYEMKNGLWGFHL